MFGGRIGLGGGGSASGVQIPVGALPTPKAWYTGETKTKEIVNPETGEKTTVSLGGYTPSQCNTQTWGSAQECCRVYKGYWYQDYGIFAPLFPDKSQEYCHESGPTFFQVPLNQELVIGGTIASIVVASVAGYMLMKKRKG